MSAAVQMTEHWEVSPHSTFPRPCNCCGERYSESLWQSLRLIGDQFSDDDEFNYKLELRNCVCGTTLGLELRSAK